MNDQGTRSPGSSRQGERPGWFDRRGNVRFILIGLYVTCALFVILDVVLRLIEFDKHPYFEWERWPGFQAVYGFVSCVLLVFLAKYVLRPLVMREENHYEGGEKGGLAAGETVRGKEEHDA